MVATPYFCVITYECSLESKVAASQVFDCNTPGLTTFDPTSLDFSFTTDYTTFSTYYWGTYRIAISGSVGLTPSLARTN